MVSRFCHSSVLLTPYRPADGQNKHAHTHTQRVVTLGLQLLNSFLFNDSSAFVLWMRAPDASISVRAMMGWFFLFGFFNKAQQRKHRGQRGVISHPSALVQAQFKIQRTNQLPARCGETPSAAATLKDRAERQWKESTI